MPATESFSQRTLEFRRVAAIGSVTREMLTEHRAVDYVYDRTLLQLETAVLAERTHSGTFTGEPVSVPNTWWDHWKQDHAPAWFQRKWPVRYRQITLTVDLTRWAHYPAASIPLPHKHLGPIVIFEDIDAQTLWD